MRTTQYRPSLIILAGALAVLSWPQLLIAQETRSLRIGATMGGVFFLSDVQVPPQFEEAVESTSFDDAFFLGLETGYRLDDRWEIEGSFLVAPESGFTAISTTGLGARFSTEIVYLAGNLIRYLDDSGARPFLSADLGTRSQDVFGLFGGASNFAFAGNVGGGVAVVTSPEFSLRLWVKDYVSSFDELEEEFENGEASVQHDLLLGAGAAFHLF